MFGFLKKLFGDDNENEIRRMEEYVERINALEPALKSLSDASLAAKTVEFRQRLENGETLELLLPEAFAVVRRLRCEQPACGILMCSCSAA